MAEVAVPGHHHRYTSSMGSSRASRSSAAGVMARAPVIEMMPNPDFAFPALPSNVPAKPATTGRRPISMQLNAPSSHTMSISHRRAASTLPSFSFNAADTSGLTETSTPPLTPSETDALTPSRRGHRRGGSEFVGGDSRLGVDGAISSSPTKSTGFPIPIPSSGPPAGRRGHAHRRSAAMSSHDVSSIMQPAQVQQPLSTSLPTTPMEHLDLASPFDRASSAPGVATESSDPLDTSMELTARPPSRRMVEFADNVEYIPRPLSTISSGTESSLSTVRGHSVNNSISSVLSLGTSSPPSFRNLTTPLSTTFEHEPKSRVRTSLEVSKRIEKEGEWLKRPSLDLARPVSASAAVEPKLTFAGVESSTKFRNPHNKRHSLSHALALGRRRSEPWISTKAGDLSRMSSLSLEDDAKRVSLVVDNKASRPLDRKSSTRKIRDWAVSKISRKTKDAKAGPEEGVAADAAPHSGEDATVPGKVPLPVAETDLDAVFSSHADADEPQRLTTPTQPRIEMKAAALSQSSNLQSRYSDDANQMVDLDAALGPFKTPSLGGPRQRRELHSSRLAKDFGGPGMHYHRRAESLPTLPAPEFGRASTPSQLSMDDVLEDDEEEAPSPRYQRPARSRSAHAETAGIGIQIVDSDISSHGSMFNLGPDDTTRIQQVDWEPERPSTSYGSVSSRLSTPVIERRASSLIEETIIEESSPVDALEIVQAHEEPRASSLTKSSDSSETPTLLGSQTGTLAFSETPKSFMTPDNSQTSTFSSPDLSRRQGSFDTSRLGTSTSSITDNRTMSSYVTSEHGHDPRMSVDEPVPSLTSSRSTMISTMHANNSRRDFSSERTPSVASAVVDPAVAAVVAQKRRNRASIQSLSQLVGGSFSGKSKAADASRPQTAVEVTPTKPPKKKEHRLKKLMFWKSKSKQSLHD